METNKTIITVETLIQATAEHVWELWTRPSHITGWNYASEDWCCPHAENDLRPGGRFSSRMEARDGSSGFDFSGTYLEVTLHHRMVYRLDDGRQVRIDFILEDGRTRLKESFEAETMNPTEMQKAGWQSILENFRRYVEKHP